MRPIDADVLVEELEALKEWETLFNTYGTAIREINEMPTLDVRPNTHAHWVKGGYTFVGVHKVDEYICSRCDYHTLEAGNYCGNCSAIMDEEVNNETN